MTKASAKEVIESVSEDIKKEFKLQKVLLSYEEFLEVFFRNPQKLVRNSAEYMLDMFCYFGIREVKNDFQNVKRHFLLFERVRGKNKPAIVGQELVHESIYRVLEQFVRQGKVDKLILLHGPNGSSKSSTAEAIASALEEYSNTEDGALYRFNWVFPSDKIGYEGLGDNSKKHSIGFGDVDDGSGALQSFAHLEDDEILCKITSDMKENPILILPRKERIEFYKKAVRERQARDFSIPLTLEEGALSSKNKKIFDSLLLAYKGDLKKVLQHVQVERFVLSARYRVGIATVEPQMAMDAQDKQLTLERNLQNIPPALQNIRLFEPQGELIDANRGFIEFSDLLKRPLEAFKYLLTTIEKMNINLSSGIADLDLIMMANSNEKHLDAFKNTADWPSFKGRFELVRVPYLLSARLEQKIYEEDIKVIEKTKRLGPHALSLLAKWAVLTRLRQPDSDVYDSSVRTLIARLTPYDKLALYEGEDLSSAFSESEKIALKKNASLIAKENQNSVSYEGRFGASPREVKMLLYFAAQNDRFDSVSAIAVFEEIEKLISDRTVYEYLQFEVRNGYHDSKEFLKFVKKLYLSSFHAEFLAALNFYDENQYVVALKKYMSSVTAYLKNEKVKNDITGNLEDPDEMTMERIEALIGVTGDKRNMREHLVAKAAAWKVENPEKEDLDFKNVFQKELSFVSAKIYENRDEEIKKIKKFMMMYGSIDYEGLSSEILKICEQTFDNLQQKFGYTRKNVWESLIFLSTQSNQ